MAQRGLGVGRFRIEYDRLELWGTPDQPTPEQIAVKLASPNADRIWFVRYAFKAGMSVEEVHRRTKIDPWFLNQILDLVRMEDRLKACPSVDDVELDLLLAAKQQGIVDAQLPTICNTSDAADRVKRKA